MRRLMFLATGVLAAALMETSAHAWTGVSTGDVNLRSHDSVRGQRLATIPQGALVEVHACPTWCHLTYRGITGWASPNYIAAVESGHAPHVYYEPAPRTYYYYRDWPPHWYGYPYPRRSYDPWRYRRFGGPGFGIYFDF